MRTDFAGFCSGQRKKKLAGYSSLYFLNILENLFSMLPNPPPKILIYFIRPQTKKKTRNIMDMNKEYFPTA